MDRGRLEKVYFCGETQINLIYTSRSGYVWRRPREKLNEGNVMGTVKHGGGGVMVWASIGVKNP